MAQATSTPPRSLAQNLTGATVTAADFGGAIGLTAQQLYSTASYQAGNLAGIGLEGNNLTAWNFASQNLAGANLSGTSLNSAGLASASLAGADLAGANLNGANLASTNLADADLRGAAYSSLSGAVLHDTILTDGTINGLALGSGETLCVRNSAVPIHVRGTPSFAGGTLQMIFDGNTWGSIISFDPGVSVSLGGTLDLCFSAGRDRIEPRRQDHQALRLERR